MIAYTWTLFLLHSVTMVIVMGLDANDAAFRLNRAMGFALMLPIYGRVLGWW